MRPAEQVRRWSEELARDPASTVFVQLARSYRESGKADAALKLCLRGLERHPHHVEAHVLLGELYADAGEMVKAHDEWDIALSLDPAHLRARRHLGLLLARSGDHAAARRHLQAVIRAQPGDSDVLAAIGRLDGPGEPGLGENGERAGVGTDPATSESREPTPRLLAGVADEPGMLGALLLDEDGLLLGGRLSGSDERHTAELAAALHGAAGEARRALEYLGLGALRNLMVETADSRLRVEPVADALLAVAAAEDVPLGWLGRRTRRLHDVADNLLSGNGA